MISEVKAVAGAVRRFRKTPCATARLRRPDRAVPQAARLSGHSYRFQLSMNEKGGRALHAPLAASFLLYD